MSDRSQRTASPVSVTSTAVASEGVDAGDANKRLSLYVSAKKFAISKCSRTFQSADGLSMESHESLFLPASIDAASAAPTVEMQKVAGTREFLMECIEEKSENVSATSMEIPAVSGEDQMPRGRATSVSVEIY